MAIKIVMAVSVERQPAECTPGREPGWYVVDRGKILATCDTEREADMFRRRILAIPREDVREELLGQVNSLSDNHREWGADERDVCIRGIRSLVTRS